MKLVTINCNECGAPLEAPKKTKFLTCGYCSAQLKISHSGGASYSEVLESVDERTSRIADDVERLKIESELERVDREWHDERESLKIRNKHGYASVPSETGGILGMIIAVVFGIFWMSQASAMGAPSIFPMFGFVFIVVGVIAGLNCMSKAKKYKSGKSEYERRRRKLYKKLRS